MEDPNKELKKSIFMRHLCLAYEKCHGKYPSPDQIDDLDKNVLDDENLNDALFGAMEEYKYLKT